MQGDGKKLIGRRSRRGRSAPVWLVGFWAAGLLWAAWPGGAAETKPTTASRPATAPAAASRPANVPPGARVLEEGWLIPPERRVKRPPLPERITEAYVIPIHDEINLTTYDSVRRKALWCKRKGAQIVIFDLDTPGGYSQPMAEIVELILTELADVYTLAHVNPKAYSAGAIIALACDEIVFSPLGRFGDAMGIYLSGGQIIELPENVRGKFETAQRTDIRVLARRNGYDVLMCQAMVTISMELWLVRNPRTGEVRVVDAAKWRNRVRNPPATTQPSRALPAPDGERWEFVDVVVGPKELVSLTAEEAQRWGFTQHVFETADQMHQQYRIAVEPTVLTDTWSENLVEILSSPAVTGILLFVGILGIYVELNTPGVGLPGAVAVIAFAILFGSRYLTGLAQWWEIALFVVGLVLIGIEVFVTPGFGVLGISGILCCVVGLLAIIIPNAPDKLPVPQTDLDWGIFKTGLTGLGLAFLAAVVTAAVLARYLPRMPLASKLILAPPTPSTGPATESAAIRSIRIGQTGTVHSICRPVGQVRFGDKLVDAIADGGFIPAGTKVKVVRNEGNRVVVTAMES